MANKEDIIKDVNIVTTLCSKYNLRDVRECNKVIIFLESKKVLKTQIGAQFLDRLKSIKSGDSTNTCFVCKKNESYDGVLCETCMTKYTNGKKSFYGKDDFDVLDEIYSNTSKTEKNVNESGSSVIDSEQIRRATEDVKDKVERLNERVQNRLQEEDVQKVKDNIKSKVITVSDKTKDFIRDNNLDEKASIAKEKASTSQKQVKSWWSKRTKQQRIIIVAFIIILLGTIATNIGNEKDISGYLNGSSKEIFKLCDKSEFYESGDHIINKKNPMFGIRTDLDVVDTVRLSESADGNYKKYSIHGIKVGDSRKTVEKIAKKLNAEPFPFYDQDCLVYIVDNTEEIYVSFDDDKAYVVKLNSKIY